MRIAMWSGPRNLSTALMYSFGNRADTAVWDEPFYAAYLTATGIDHPLGTEIMADGHHGPEAVIGELLGTIPDEKPVFYQKHMTQHMIQGFDRSWMDHVTNVFLIRHPARVIASYAVKRENPTYDDIGFWQQAVLFEQVCTQTGDVPAVIDSADIRADPEGTLRALCDRIGLPFYAAMLAWPKGGHKEDGAWAPHWYGSVWNSTGFAGAEGSLPEINAVFNDTMDKAMANYLALYAHRITA